MSSDPAKAKEFYSALLGWTFDEASDEYGNYVTCQSDGHNVAGMMANPGTGAPDGWNTYICTQDAHATAEAAAGAGGKVLMPVMEVPEQGVMAMIADPAGAVFGVWQPIGHIGFQKYNEANSVTWDELHSKDFPASKDFYGAVFGWNYQVMGDTDEFRYVTGQVDGQDVLGMMDASGYLPAEVPSHWAVYFSVEDVDAACAKAVELGGSVIRPAEDTPFGRIADMTDATGANFKLHGPVTEAAGS
ncbi:MAG TPA: VOC family protein [Jatrophihabitans sp.]|nr:VOC family protein [Jatrophihabitans sp.]